MNVSHKSPPRRQFRCISPQITYISLRTLHTALNGIPVGLTQQAFIAVLEDISCLLPRAKEIKLLFLSTPKGDEMKSNPIPYQKQKQNRNI